MWGLSLNVPARGRTASAPKTAQQWETATETLGLRGRKHVVVHVYLSRRRWTSTLLVSPLRGVFYVREGSSTPLKRSRRGGGDTSQSKGPLTRSFPDLRSMSDFETSFANGLLGLNLGPLPSLWAPLLKQRVNPRQSNPVASATHTARRCTGWATCAHKYFAQQLAVRL